MSMYRMVAFIGFILVQSHLAISEPTVFPTDAVVRSGDSVIFYCTRPSLHWIYDNDNDIYIFGVLQKRFSEKGIFIRGNQSLGEANLFIENVTVDMAGEYSCGEWGTAFEDYKSVPLIVLENNPVCHVAPVSDNRNKLHPDRIRPNECRRSSSYSSTRNDSLRTPTNEFVGPNTCGIPPEEISLSCRVTFFGLSVPDFELRNSKESTVVECSETIAPMDSPTGPKLLTCNVTLKASTHLHGAQLIWKTTNSAQTQYNYTTEPLKILYSVDSNLPNHTAAQVGDKVSCTASCSHPISYKWSWFETPGQGGYKCTRELEVTHAGLYTCEAMCQMGKQLCAVTAMQVEVYSSSATERVFGETATTDLKTIVPITIGCLAVFVGVIAALVHLLLNRRKNRSENETAADEAQNNIHLSLLNATHKSSS